VVAPGHDCAQVGENARDEEIDVTCNFIVYRIRGSVNEYIGRYVYTLVRDGDWFLKGNPRPVRDVSELLVELGEVRAPRRPLSARVVYHDACHLAHGQGVRSQPRALPWIDNALRYASW